MRTTFLVLFLVLVAPICVFAKMEPVADMDVQIAGAQQYLNALDTAKARFVQTAHDGTELSGTFYLDRPGKLRFEYDAPIEDFVTADGRFIYFYDAELGEQTNAPIGQTLADFLLRENVDLGGDVMVRNVKRGGGYVQLDLVLAEDPEGGSLMLAFTEEPFAIKKWRVIDGQGLITEVELFDLKTGMKFKDSFFAYRDPKGRKKLNQ